jgi:hypothetical protein
LSANDLLVIWFIMLPEWLDSQFSIDLTTQYDWCCKVASYTKYVFYTLSPYFLVLACLDRLCTSSTNARLRKIATLRIASILILAMTVVICLVYSYILFSVKLLVIASSPYCTMTDPVYNRLLSISIICIFCVMPPILMGLLGTLTFTSLRGQKNRIMPVNQVRQRQRDNRLLKMLFIYVASNMLCVAPFSITYFITINYSGDVTTTVSSLIELFRILVFLAYATSFYMYTLSTPFYRDELLSLFRRVWKWFRRVNNIDANV